VPEPYCAYFPCVVPCLIDGGAVESRSMTNYNGLQRHGLYDRLCQVDQIPVFTLRLLAGCVECVERDVGVVRVLFQCDINR
jgi:hypothetical protein